MTVSPVSSEGPSQRIDVGAEAPPPPSGPEAPVAEVQAPEEVTSRQPRPFAEVQAHRATAAGERALAEDALRGRLDAALEEDLVHADVDWPNAPPPQVRELQTELDTRGFDPGPIDGVWGPRTSGALDRARAADGPAEVPVDTPPRPVVDGLAGLPPRAPDAPTGSEFLELTANMDPEAREEAITNEILNGNIPDFLRNNRDVSIVGESADGEPTTIDLSVTPDYLAIGTDDDYVRIPMTPDTAQAIADATGTSLPTTRIVDEIYAAADGQLTPDPLPPGPGMTTNGYYGQHQADVEGQRIAAGFENGDLLAGHKKDVVITNRLERQPDRVAIYGWHQPSGRPIQSLSLVHGDYYADYSHGVRLVDAEVRVNGEVRNLSDVLADPNLAHLLSSEGPLRVMRHPD
ncbi:MAG: peptidoglycan-binding domain-containing protein [Deltaproteobacteria bacterium]|jgi:peptidoglycan hydrolase-like protein with peptidoglycan-binding domain